MCVRNRALPPHNHNHHQKWEIIKHTYEISHISVLTSNNWSGVGKFYCYVNRNYWKLDQKKWLKRSQNDVWMDIGYLISNIWWYMSYVISTTMNEKQKSKKIQTHKFIWEVGSVYRKMFEARLIQGMNARNLTFPSSVFFSCILFLLVSCFHCLFYLRLSQQPLFYPLVSFLIWFWIDLLA